MIANLTLALYEQGVCFTVFAPVGRRVGRDPLPLPNANVSTFPTGRLAIAWVGYTPSMSRALPEALMSHDWFTSTSCGISLIMPRIVRPVQLESLEGVHLPPVPPCLDGANANNNVDF